MKYKKSQIGWVATCLFALVIIFLLLSYANQWGSNPIPYTPFLVLLLLFIALSITFYKLTIELNGSTLKLIYGIGLLKMDFKIDELNRTEVIKIPWYFGFGIRITPKGMLYNIQGSKAINIEYTSKGKRKSVMIGTPEPEQLQKALKDNYTKSTNDAESV